MMAWFYQWKKKSVMRHQAADIKKHKVILTRGIGMILSLSIPLAYSSQSVDEPTAETLTTRPKIALVLAGGGAKGAAHIGVLMALEELRIPVDMVLGTSMGAYIAGLYASGMSAADIDALVASIDWNEGYRDRVSRSQRRVRDKEYEDRYQLRTDIGIGLDGIHVPHGMVQGQNMLRILRQSTNNMLPLSSFDHLPIPYRAVATDILELAPVVLDSGYLVDAFMASMSVPGALPPYEVNGRWLVDGGITNNMPIDVAQQMGADLIIAVDISSEYKNQESFTNFLAAAEQLSTYIVRSTTERQAEQLAEKDILLRPKVGLMETTEFDKMPKALIQGYQAAKADPRLTQLSLSAEEYAAYQYQKQQKRQQLRYGGDTSISKIVLNNHSHYSDGLLSKRLELNTKDKLTQSDIERSVQDLYALDRFKLVNYYFQDETLALTPELNNGLYNEDVYSSSYPADAKQQLVFDVQEKTWGPNYLNFRFFLEDDFNTASQYSIGSSLNFTDITPYGAELALNVDMGTDKLLEGELYSPLSFNDQTFSSMVVRFAKEQEKVPLTGFDDTSLSASRNYLPVNFKSQLFQLALGYQNTLWQEFKVGGRYMKGDAYYSSLPDYGDMKFKRQSAFASYRYDTLDNFSLPRYGFYLDMEYSVSHDRIYSANLGIAEASTETVYEFILKWIAAQSWDRHSLVNHIDYGEVRSKGSATPIRPQSIGGFLNLSGIPRGSLIGLNKAYANVIYRYRWFDNDFGLFTSPVYLGAAVEYGGVWSAPDMTIDAAPLYLAGAVFAGIDSPFGPVLFGYGRTKQNFQSVYLILGTTF